MTGPHVVRTRSSTIEATAGQFCLPNSCQVNKNRFPQRQRVTIAGFRIVGSSGRVLHFPGVKEQKLFVK